VELSTIFFKYLVVITQVSQHNNLLNINDLMRLLPDSGCEYGVDWIVKELIEENLEFINSDEIFEQMIENCYEETTQIGFMKLSTVQVMKDQDPICWDIAKGEYIDGLAEDEQLITFDNGSNHYWIHDIENYIEENLELEAA
jgi:hypothetical protein